jgi:hypothetical protein
MLISREPHDPSAAMLQRCQSDDPDPSVANATEGVNLLQNPTLTLADVRI